MGDFYCLFDDFTGTLVWLIEFWFRLLCLMAGEGPLFPSRYCYKFIFVGDIIILT